MHYNKFWDGQKSVFCIFWGNEAKTPEVTGAIRTVQRRFSGHLTAWEVSEDSLLKSWTPPPEVVLKNNFDTDVKGNWLFAAAGGQSFWFEQPKPQGRALLKGRPEQPGWRFPQLVYSKTRWCRLKGKLLIWWTRWLIILAPMTGLLKAKCERSDCYYKTSQPGLSSGPREKAILWHNII